MIPIKANKWLWDILCYSFLNQDIQQWEAFGQYVRPDKKHKNIIQNSLQELQLLSSDVFINRPDKSKLTEEVILSSGIQKCWKYFVFTKESNVP